MYALICLAILGLVWMALITKVLINLRGDDQSKHLTQEYFRKKIEELKKDINEKE